MSAALETTAIQDTPAPLVVPARCQLQNRAFTAFAGVTFRRAESDGSKVMVVPLGEREAALPIQVLRREFDIESDSEDDRMLSLIDAALDHVPDIALGDELPREVLTGEASWQAEPHHLWLAAAKLRAELLSWLHPGRQSPLEPAELMEALMTDLQLREQVQAAFDQAAHVLGLARAEDAVAVVDQVAKELSYIEALRDWLLGRMQAMVRRLATVPPQRGLDRQRGEMLQRVGYLASASLRDLRDRFDVLDAQTGELMAVLRNVDQQIAYIRQHRDALHNEFLAWNDVLTAWDKLPPGLGEGFWELLSETYHLLAHRHLPETNWRRTESAASSDAKPREMSW